MKNDEWVLAFIVAWILVLHNGNHAQLTIEDVVFIDALKANLLTNWVKVVVDTILKSTKLPNYPLPYVVFLSKVFEHYNVDLFRETSYDHTNQIGANALHHMGTILWANTWVFKDEPVEEQATNANPQLATMSRNDYESAMLKMVATLLDHHQT